MNFSELMSLISLTTPFFCSLQTGWKEDKGFGVLIGLIVGLALGAGCFFGSRMLFKWIRHHPEISKTKPQPVWLMLSWFLCFVLFMWIFGLTFCGMWLTKIVAHHIS